MNLKILYYFSVLFFSLSLPAETTFYGKLGITAENENNNVTSESDLVSNSSRIGFKGDLNTGSNLSLIYQLEYELDPVDGKADESKERTLKQRNTFVGIKGSLGTLFLGTHDTAFKESQEKIDLFDDLASDIKNILEGENRLSELVGFTTPVFGKNFSATFNLIKENDGLDDASSFSLKYKTSNI